MIFWIRESRLITSTFLYGFRLARFHEGGFNSVGGSGLGRRKWFAFDPSKPITQDSVRVQVLLVEEGLLLFVFTMSRCKNGVSLVSD